ncbi:MAG: hypothetical protein FWD62_09650 [Betaproteobacteria bacterium]|nr:hypothetical protein [Betaproteobacteria bacterium]
MRVILFFFTLTVLMVGGLYFLVHRETRPTETLRAAANIPAAIKAPELPRFALEPAQPPNSHINKCIENGRVLYTDDPCPRGHTERKLDPKRSRIVVLPAESGKQAAMPAQPAGRQMPQINIEDDGRITRTVSK